MKKSIGNNSEERLIEKSEMLNEVVQIIDSHTNEYFIAYEMCKRYDNAENFRKSYSMIQKYRANDVMFKDNIDKVDTIYNLFLEYENKGLVDEVKYIMKNESIFSSYKYAKFIVESYVNDKSYNTNQFFSSMGVDRDIFDYCLCVIEDLDVDLLKKYEEKKEENKKLRYKANIITFKKMAHAIKTGTLADGTEFDKIEFYKMAPFKYSTEIKKEFDDFKKINPKITYYPHGNWVNQINIFTQATLPLENVIIMDYMRKEKISKYTYVYEEKLRTENSSTSVIFTDPSKIPEDPTEMSLIIENVKNNTASYDGVVRFTIEDTDNIINYMKNNDLPFLKEVFIALKKKYINDELDMNRVSTSNKNKQKVLIP